MIIRRKDEDLMQIFQSILALLAGVGVFVIGMNMMSDALQKVAGPGMKKLIGKITNNRFAGVGIGAGVTALIQSSAATTVMAIGFVNAGAMTLAQATSIIMGANIGTTVTGLLVSLESLNISLYASVLAFIGIMMTFVKKNDRIHNIGGILAGLGLLFIGLKLVGQAFKNDEVLNAFMNLFQVLDFPLLLVLFGVLLTALIQSSSAMTGLVIMMAGSGAITIGDALFITIGANVGTCFTSLLAIIGSSTNAKRTGFMHLTFNLIGSVLFTIIVWIFSAQIQELLKNTGLNKEFQIAVFHVVFNVVTTLILLPFTRYLVKFIEHIVPDKPNELAHTLKFIDRRELRTPAIAVMQVKKEIENMANLAKENLEKGFYEVCNQEGKYDLEIEKRENAIDYINAEVTDFLIKLSPLVTGSNLEQVGSYYHVINDIERIGDHAENLLKDAQHMHEKGIKFSSVAEAELKTMFDTVEQMFAIAIKTFDTSIDVDLKELSDLEAKTDDLKHQLSISHFERLAQENCTMELGGYFTSIISGLERVGDHLVNIGYSIQDPTGNQNERTDNYNFYWE